MVNLIEIESRYFEECNVVMLPTEKGTLISLRNDNKLFFDIDRTISNTKRMVNQHLYITSDDEIKEGDWFYDNLTNKIKKWNTSVKCKAVITLKKIIATTDRSLKTSVFSHYSQDLMKVAVYKDNYLAEPSHKFIKAFVKAGGIDKVLVEYESKYDIRKRQSPKFIADALSTDRIRKYVKTDSHNTITIKLVEEKMYSREEVEKLCINAYEEGYSTCWFHESNKGKEVKIEDWLKENL